jgi:hypothetical protein
MKRILKEEVVTLSRYYCLGVCPEGLRNTMRNLNQDSLCRGQDSN